MTVMVLSTGLTVIFVPAGTLAGSFSILVVSLMPNRGITDGEALRRSEDYERAMFEVSMFTAEGKNSNDDAPDSLTQLAMMFEDKFATPPTRVVHSPF